jgi:hypothetical protein
MNFRTMLQPGGNQEFLQIMQREVDVIHTDNTLLEQQNDPDMNPLSSGRPHREREQPPESAIREKPREKGGWGIRRNQTVESLSTAGTDKVIEKMVQLEAKCRGMELRLAGVETRLAKGFDAPDLKARVEAIEKTLAELKLSMAGKGGRPEKSSGQKSRDGKRESGFTQPRKTEHLSDVISTLKSKLEYRNSLIKNLSKPEN